MLKTSTNFATIILVFGIIVSLFSCAEEINPIDSSTEQLGAKEDTSVVNPLNNWTKVDYGSDTVYIGIDSLIRTPGSSFGRMAWTNNKKLETTVTIIDKDDDTVFVRSYGTGYFKIQFDEFPKGKHHLIFSDINGPIKDELIINP